MSVLATLVAAPLVLAASQAEAGTSPFAALALRQEEREELLALALAHAVAGDCEHGLDLLDAAAGAGGTEDELGRRIALERERLVAWRRLRDELLADLAASKKPLALELDGKKVSSAFTREGDELVLARGPAKRLSVRALAPEALVPQVPKERFEGADEWLKIYPYCLTANPKWKRFQTTTEAAAALGRDAEEFYPRASALAPVVLALERLSARPGTTSGADARAALAEVDALLASRAVPCVAGRLAGLAAVAERLLVAVAESLELAELVRAKVSSGNDGASILAYDFADATQVQDWRPSEGYLDGLRDSLDPVTAPAEPAFAPGAGGFRGNGEACWEHALEFLSPFRVRYRIRWEPFGDQPGRAFSFAVGCLADAEERHVRVNELGFLYVDELDGPYVAVRPKGDATVQLGQTYTVELVHDGRDAKVRVDDVERARASAPGRTEGRLFLWSHSDVRIAIPEIEIEARVAPASLAAARAAWVRSELAARGLDAAK